MTDTETVRRVREAFSAYEDGEASAFQLAGRLAYILADGAASQPSGAVWLVELFLPNDGNSLGFYHMGHVTLNGKSVSSRDPCLARKYSKARAEIVAAELGHTLQGVWRATEHIFDTPSAAQAPAVPEGWKIDVTQAVDDKSWWLCVKSRDLRTILHKCSISEIPAAMQFRAALSAPTPAPDIESTYSVLHGGLVQALERDDCDSPHRYGQFGPNVEAWLLGLAAPPPVPQSETSK